MVALMLPVIYVFAISFAAAILYVSVVWFETNRRLALVLKLLIFAAGAAAITSQLMPSPALLALCWTQRSSAGLEAGDLDLIPPVRIALAETRK